MGMKKRYFALELSKNYKSNMAGLIEDYSFLSSERSGSLMYCSLFIKDMLLLIPILIGGYLLLFWFIENHVIAGLAFLISMVLVAYTVNAKWFIEGDKLFFVSPLNKKKMYVGNAVSCSFKLSNSKFIIEIIQEGDRKIVLKDTSLRNVYAPYCLIKRNISKRSK